MNSMDKIKQMFETMKRTIIVGAGIAVETIVAKFRTLTIYIGGRKKK